MSETQSKDADIPIIDISNPTAEVAQQVLDAASTHGFLFIQNDGSIIPVEDIANMFDLSARFFKQPTAQKATHSISTPSAGGPNRGWVAPSAEALDPSTPGDPKEAFNISPPHPMLQPLPQPLSASAPAIETFLSNCHALCTRVLALLARALQIPEEDGGERWFADRHDERKGASGTIFRMLYYPASSISSPTPSMRAGAHSDYGTLTLLFRLPGQPGLEILSPSGTWVPVPVLPAPITAQAPPILINIGDLLSFWTAGLLKSTLHRVVSAGGAERYSMAYFCHPLDKVRLEIVPGDVVRGFVERGDGEGVKVQRERLGMDGEGDGGYGGVMTAKEHLERRLRVTYGVGG